MTYLRNKQKHQASKQNNGTSPHEGLQEWGSGARQRSRGSSAYNLGLEISITLVGYLFIWVGQLRSRRRGEQSSPTVRRDHGKEPVLFEVSWVSFGSIVKKTKCTPTFNQFEPVAHATQYGAIRMGNCSAATTHPRGPQVAANPKMKMQEKAMRILPATTPSGSGEGRNS